MDQLFERVGNLETRVDNADEARRNLESSLLEELAKINAAINGLTKSVGDFAAQLLRQNLAQSEHNNLQDVEIADLRKQFGEFMREYLVSGAKKAGVATAGIGGLSTVIWIVAEAVKHFGGGS